jgi:hypothetical protein
MQLEHPKIPSGRDQIVQQITITRPRSRSPRDQTRLVNGQAAGDAAPLTEELRRNGDILPTTLRSGPQPITERWSVTAA